LAELDKAVLAAPREAEARICRAECLRRQGRLSEAEADLEMAVGLAPDNPEPCVIMAQIHAAGSRFASALAYLERAELIDSEWHRVHLIRGDVLLASGKDEAAAESYRRAVGLAPQKVEPMTALASLLMERGQAAEAARLADSALALAPNSSDARLIKALHHSGLGQLDAALAELNRAARINPAHARVRLERGMVLLAMNRLDEAWQDFLWVSGKEPDNVQALCGLGESAWRSGRIRQAIDAYTRVIDMGGAAPDVYQSRAEALSLAGCRAEAVADCSKALELDPLNSDLHAMRGSLNLELERYDEAARDLGRAIALDGDLVEAIVSRGELRRRQGDAAGAIADFAAAVRLSPDDPDLLVRWLRSIGDAGDCMTALRLLERELKRLPNISKLAMLKGDLLAEAMRPEAAEACYRELIRQIPDEIEPHLRLVEFYENRANHVSALEELDQAVRIDPYDPFPRLMRAALLERLGRSSEAELERAASSRLRRMRGI
jgi:tetratricopeptide (TPR) repeat protein